MPATMPFASLLVPLLLVHSLLLGACADEERNGNQRPVVMPLTAETDEDISVVLDVLAVASDPEGDKLFLRAASAKGHTAVVTANGRSP